MCVHMIKTFSSGIGRKHGSKCGQKAGDQEIGADTFYFSHFRERLIRSDTDDSFSDLPFAAAHS